MIIVRYFFWLLVYHLSMFLKIWPHQMIIGLLLWPCHFLRSWLIIPPQQRNLSINMATGLLLSVWEGSQSTAPPEFIRKRFVAMHTATLRR